MVSKASELLPEPDRPVSTTSCSRGMSTETFFRLCSRAPRTRMKRCGSDIMALSDCPAGRRGDEHHYVGSKRPFSAGTLRERKRLCGQTADSFGSSVSFQGRDAALPRPGADG